jgi:hypothetical protein
MSDLLLLEPYARIEIVYTFKYIREKNILIVLKTILYIVYIVT